MAQGLSLAPDSGSSARASSSAIFDGVFLQHCLGLLVLTAFVCVGKVWCAGQTVITACCDALVPSSQRMWHSGALYGVQAAASIVLSSVLQSASSERTQLDNFWLLDAARQSELRACL